MQTIYNPNRLGLESLAEEHMAYAVDQLLGRLQIPITQTALQKDLMAHPAFPDIGSLLDALENWGVSHMLVELKPEHLQVIDYPAIAWIRQEGASTPVPVCLTELSGDFIQYQLPDGSVQGESLQAFATRWEGQALLAEHSPYAGDPHLEKHQEAERAAAQLRTARVSGAILIALLFIGMWASQPALLAVGGPWLVLKSLGLLLAAMAVRSQLNKQDRDMARWCFRGGKQDCTSIVQSDWGNWRGISLAELALGYFTGGLIWTASSVALSSPTETLSLIWHLAWLGLPFILFSLIIQMAVLRQICTVCLSIAGIWGIELLLGWIQGLALPSFGMMVHSLPGIFIFTGLGLAWSWIKPRLNMPAKLLEAQGWIRSYRRMPGMFAARYLQGRQIETEVLPGDLVWGLETAPHELLLYIDPLCDPCANSWRKALRLKRRMDDQLRIRVRFYAAVPGVPGMAISQRILSVAHRKGIDAAVELLGNWFSQPDREPSRVPNWLNQHAGTLISPGPPAENWKQTAIQWAREANLPGIPYIFLNQHLVQADDDFYEDLGYYLKTAPGNNLPQEQEML